MKMSKYKILYSKEKVDNAKVFNIIPEKEIQGYIVYVRESSFLWCLLSFIPCFPICIKENCIIYQEPIYDDNFAPF